MDIGLGWHLLKSQSKNIWYWHNGGTGGYSSSMVFDEKTENGIIILSNVSAFNPNMGNIDKLCFELMKTLEKE
jgi:CubicO group peptidase (beta-lactamase class C family)